MKKFCKITVAVLAIVMTVSGCGINKKNSSSTDAQVNAQAITDVYVNAGNAETVDNSEAYNVYLDACEKMENADSITIVSDMYIAIGEDASDAASSTLVTIKRQKTGDSFDVSLTMNNSYNGESQSEIKGYYTDGLLYFTSAEDKIKEEMSYDDLMSIIGNYVLSFDEDMISQAAVLADGDDSKYFFDMDKDMMAQMMESNLAASGAEFEEGDYIETVYSGMEAKVDSDGVIVGFKLGMQAIIHDSQGDTPVIYNIDSEFLDVDNTDIDVIDNLDEFLSSEEYMAQLETEETTSEADASAEEITVAE